MKSEIRFRCPGPGGVREISLPAGPDGDSGNRAMWEERVPGLGPGHSLDVEMLEK